MTTSKEILKDTEHKMKKTIEATVREFATVRTGRAQSGIVEGIMVDYYGAPTPLKQIANISTPEPRLIVINPWDKSAMGDVEKAILKANIGLTPNNDGKVIRITVPQLTQERREELKKVLKHMAEAGKVSLRTARRSANEHLDKLEKDKKITEDDKFSSKDDCQKLIEKYEKELDKHLEDKEKEISEI
ncbi:MAG: ribosome recycling factor [Candidatus Omnitrophota bacterium]